VAEPAAVIASRGPPHCLPTYGVFVRLRARP